MRAPGADTADRRLRVAVDATALIGRPTGVGAFCAGLLGALGARTDVEVWAFAVTWRRRGAIVGALPAGVAARQRPMPARPLHLAWRRFDLPPVEWFVGHPDVIHGTNFVVPPARTAATVVTVHDLTPVRYPELCEGPTLAFPSLIAAALRRGAFVHTPSAFVAAEVIEVFGADPDRVRPVHSGIPGPPLRAPADPGAVERWRPAGTDRYILSVGTAEPRKDLPGLVRAFDLLAADHPDVGLVLAGPGGWGEGELAEALEACGHRERVRRTGWVDEATLSALLGGAAVLAYPSRYEGFGFPPLQAMAAGVPVVATRAGAVPEVVGDAALLVPVGDVSSLAGALSSVLDDAGTAADLVTRGRRRAGAFTWDRCAEGMAALYADAAADRRGPR